MPIETRRLDDVISTLIDYRGKTPTKTASGVRLVTAKVIKDGFINDSSFEYIAEEEYDTWMRRGLPQQWDVLITTEAPLGEVAQLRSSERVALAQRVILLRSDPEVMDQGFLFQALKSPFVQAELAKRATGTTVLGIKQSELREILIPYYPIRAQRRIADILSAYDDLIENNTRRINILEEMARSLYREWFVNFRFPGHEKVKLVASPIGKVPERWSLQTVEQTFEIAGGGTPSKEVAEYWSDGDINWYTPSDLTGAGTMFMDSSADRITSAGLARSSARLFAPMSVMMTSRATIGAIAINTTEACTNQGFITCLPNARFPLYFLYCWLKENVPLFIRLGTGATFKEVTKGTFKRIEVAVPPEQLIRRFEFHVEAMGSQILNLERQNRSLRTTRDLLLPRLISGEINVSRLEPPRP